MPFPVFLCLWLLHLSTFDQAKFQLDCSIQVSMSCSSGQLGLSSLCHLKYCAYQHQYVQYYSIII